MCLLRRRHSAGLRECSEKGRPLESGARSSSAEAEGGTSASRLEHVHDGIVQLREHHKVDGKAGSAVLGGRIAREPREGIVLLQYKPARENTEVSFWAPGLRVRLEASAAHLPPFTLHCPTTGATGVMRPLTTKMRQICMETVSRWLNAKIRIYQIFYQHLAIPVSHVNLLWSLERT